MSDVTTIAADVPAPYADAVQERLQRAQEVDVVLHCTGQVHKGGPATGFLQLVDEPAGDLEIPGEPYSFATLIRAQADRDLQTLRGHGLDAARVHVEHTDQIKELI